MLHIKFEMTDQLLNDICADHVISIGRDGSLSLWNLHIFGDGESARLATLDLGEALDGVHVHGDTAVVGDRRGGVHAVTIRS